MKTVLITGASGRIGKVLAARFLDDGWTVVATASSRESATKLAESLGPHARLAVFACDLLGSDGPQRLLAQVLGAGHQVTHLINNARSLSTLKVDQNGLAARSDFVGEFVLDVIVPYELTMLFAQASGSRLEGVVNIGSMYGVVAANLTLYDNPKMESPIQYGVSKAALHHLTRELAVRLASSGVQVNCVAFGGVRGRTGDAFEARYASMVPNQRMLDDPDLFAPVAFLCGTESSGITGHVLMVDGGWSVW